MQRTFLVLAFGLICGGIIGAYATTTVYGKRRVAAPQPAPSCPACPVCPTCPPPVDCDAPPPVVSPTAPARMFDDPEDPIPDPGASRRPGLPASAIGLASRALMRAIEPCRTSSTGPDESGSLLLELTITATSGVGHIRQTDVNQSEGDLEVFQSCVLEAAAEVQFEWTGEDGESRLKYPVRLR